MQTKNSYFLDLTPLRELMFSRTLWFSLSIVFSILYSILFLQVAFGSEYSIQDDARLSIVDFQERIGLTGYGKIRVSADIELRGSISLVQ